LKLDEASTVEKRGRYFLLPQQLKKMASDDFFYAGTYLGKTRHGVFFPSFPLLAMMSQRKEANKITVDEKTAWLFIVGRDVFKQGIVSVNGSGKKGTHTFVMNQNGECLGFGRITHSLDEKQGKSVVAVRNISDIGDFLRRERRLRD